MSAYNVILQHICVCRTFRLDGLQHILQKTNQPLEPVQIIWQIGELTAKGLVQLDKSLYNYIVVDDKDEILNARRKLQREPLFCNLHKEWRNWFYEAYNKHFSIEDFAALLHHGLFYSHCCISRSENLSNILCFDLIKNLYAYCRKIATESNVSFEYPDFDSDFRQAFVKLISCLEEKNYDRSNEVASYPIKLYRYIQELNLFKDILDMDDEDKNRFLTVLNSLNT